jgi:hypothetical protein|tara:strand:+ start:2417 stop:2599 length:183 start_codon:yes stop_codon:yes gene_type:complete
MEGKQTKLYTIEVVEGDEIFTGTDIPADSQEEAMNTMMFMFMGRIDRDSQILNVEENRIH